MFGITLKLERYDLLITLNFPICEQRISLEIFIYILWFVLCFLNWNSVVFCIKIFYIFILFLPNIYFFNVNVNDVLFISYFNVLLMIDLVVPKSTLRNDELLERLEKLRKTFTIMVIIYYSKRIHIQLAKARRVQLVREQAQALGVCSPG